MIIFKDIFTGDELFSDSYKYKIVDDLYYHIEGKFVQQREDGNYDIGANPSAEEATEETEASVSSGIDLAIAQRLVEVNTNKAGYKKEIRIYSKALVAKVGEKDAARAEFLKANLQKVIVEWIGDFDNMSPYKGESTGADGTYVLCKFPKDCPVGCKIDIFILKDAVEEEKC